jgi:branched-chain amino acid transport system substrate-binding protein
MGCRHGWARILGALAFAAAGALSAGAAWAEDIVIAQIGPFTVNDAPDTGEIHEGAQAYMAQLNAHGGIRGRRVTLLKMDDRFNGDEFARQVQIAQQRHAIALLSPLGSATLVQALRDKVFDSADLLVVNAVPGAEVLRSPGHPKLLHVRAGDRQQIEKILQHLRVLSLNKVHVLYQDIPIGGSGFAIASEAGRRDGLTVTGTQSKFEPGALERAAQAVRAAQPQAVLVVGTTTFMGNAIKHLRQAGVSQWLFALSYLSPPILLKIAGPEAARGVGIAQTYPNPNGVSLPLQREFNEAMRARDPTPRVYTPFHLEGYVAARVIAEGLSRATEAKPDALAKALRSAGEMNIGGFRVDFSKGNTGSSFVDIAVVTAEGRLRY